MILSHFPSCQFVLFPSPSFSFFRSSAVQPTNPLSSNCFNYLTKQNKIIAEQSCIRERFQVTPTVVVKAYDSFCTLTAFVPGLEKKNNFKVSFLNFKDKDDNLELVSLFFFFTFSVLCVLCIHLLSIKFFPSISSFLSFLHSQTDSKIERNK